MSEFTLTVEKRENLGKNHNRRLRAAGQVPAVVYGGGRDPLPIQVERKPLSELLKTQGGEHAVFLLKLKGTDLSRHTMIRHLDVDPIRRQVRHVDFQRIVMTEKVRVAVAVEVVGTPFGVRNEGGMLDFVTREVEVECLPGDIPTHLQVDVNELHVGEHVEASQILLPAGVTLIEDGDRVIASIAHTRAAEAEAVAAAPTLLEAERAEPEVIRRGKVEEGEE